MDAVARLSGHDALAERLEKTLVPEPPIQAQHGGFVAEGVDAELDQSRRLRDEGKDMILALQPKYAEQAEVAALKVRYNNVLGYFVEVSANHAAKMMAEPLSDTFRHRQTMANAVRFSTVEMSELETGMLTAGDRALAIEKRIFVELRETVLEAAAAIANAARALAEIDVAASLADLAVSDGWTRPVVESGQAFRIEAGRHPVVEQALRRSGESPFVANDCDLSGGGHPVWLLTGPNMAGKSTFLRQNALIALLAQMGAYVPAQRALIGAVDQLFSRVGAADDLARGRSTFMVEMVETAAILNQAGPGALVILDEIGRGTATYDGLSIAWATLEHLHAVNTCRTLFATHYHELTALAGKLDGVRNATMAVKEWRGDVVFLHEVKAGAADRSYGVQVARLAGLPGSVIDRAREVLEALETSDRESGRADTLIEDLPLFAAGRGSAHPPTPAPRSAVEERLEALDPDAMTPRDALEALYALKAALGERWG